MWYDCNCVVAFISISFFVINVLAKCRQFFPEYIDATGGDGGDDNDDDNDISAHSCKIPIELWKKSSWWDRKPRTENLE